MTSTLQFRYYDKDQSDQFSFYRIPKALFTDVRFRGISAEAKILYGLMLDRMSLSRKNGWSDQENHVYIYFTLEDVLELMGCGHGKAVRLFAELDSVKGIGLIERRKQGQGKPARIYVKNFLEDEASDEFKTSQNRKSESEGFCEEGEQSPFFSSLAEFNTVQTSCFEKSALLKKGSPDFPERSSLDFPKSDGNNIENNKTEYSQIKIIYPSQDRMDKIEHTRERQQMKAQICYNIEYDVLFSRNPTCKQEIDEMVLLMTEVATSKRSTIRLDQQELPQPMVKERMLSLQCEHIEYVLESVKNSTTQIHNIRAYLLTALYHAPETIHHYYAAQMREQND